MSKLTTSRFHPLFLVGVGAAVASVILLIFLYFWSKNAPDPKAVEVPSFTAVNPQTAQVISSSREEKKATGFTAEATPPKYDDLQIPPVPPTSESAQSTAAHCRTATSDQASNLLTRLFPESKMLNFEPLALDAMKSLCLLEVEMLADKTNVATKGFVYVFPDGERFLNGPLMDKRSQVSVQNVDIQAEIEKARAEQKAVIEGARMSRTDKLNNQNAEPALPNAPDALTPLQSPAIPQTVKPDLAKEQAKRTQFLQTLQDLSAIESGMGKNDVYVMFDPQCVHCHRLYAQHPALVAKYNLRFHWIPIFMNDSSWVMSAFLLKTAQSSPAAAQKLLAGMMDKSWDPKTLPEDAAAINSMSPQDYELPRKATIAFFDATKENKALGTPVVAFRAPNGVTEIISGEPYDSDWAIFDGKTASTDQ